jgi:hypothetical protein
MPTKLRRFISPPLSSTPKLARAYRRHGGITRIIGGVKSASAFFARAIERKRRNFAERRNHQVEDPIANLIGAGMTIIVADRAPDRFERFGLSRLPAQRRHC